MAIDWRAVGPHSACLTTLSRVNLKHMFGMKIWWTKKRKTNPHGSDCFPNSTLSPKLPTRGADPQISLVKRVFPTECFNQATWNFWKLWFLESLRIALQYQWSSCRELKAPNGKRKKWGCEQKKQSRRTGWLIKNCGCWVFSWHAHTWIKCRCKSSAKGPPCERKMKGVKFGGPHWGSRSFGGRSFGAYQASLWPVMLFFGMNLIL